MTPSGVQQTNMVLEQVMTILVCTAIGVDLVLVTVRPRRYVHSRYLASFLSVETISLPCHVDAVSGSAASPLSALNTVVTGGGLSVPLLASADGPAV